MTETSQCPHLPLALGRFLGLTSGPRAGAGKAHPHRGGRPVGPQPRLRTAPSPPHAALLWPRSSPMASRTGSCRKRPTVGGRTAHAGPFPGRGTWAGCRREGQCRAPQVASGWTARQGCPASDQGDVPSCASSLSGGGLAGRAPPGCRHQRTWPGRAGGSEGKSALGF